jgi:hypothetical protein
MKLKLFGLLTIILFSCNPDYEIPVNSSDTTHTDTAHYTVGCKPVDTTAEKKVTNARMTAAEPDFWNPNYRSYKVCTLYVEVAYNIYVNEGMNASNAEAKMRSFINLCSEASERIDGVKYVVGNMFIHTTPDPYVNVRDAVSGLYLFGNNTINITAQPFKVFLTDANIGGCAYISAGSVTSAKWAFVSLARNRPLNSRDRNYALLSFNHELHHNLGLQHSHNDCAWLDKNGNRLGPLDSCYACENNKACPPTIKCVGTTKRMAGDFMSYCHIYGTAEVMLKAPELAVLHKSLYYSSLPNYTPTTQPPPPVVTNPVSLQTTYKGTDGKWRIKFTVPINQITYPTYSLNVCRYDAACTVTQACGSRGTITSLTTTEKATGIVDRVLSPQPANLNSCYRTSVTCNNVAYWTASYITN